MRKSMFAFLQFVFGWKALANHLSRKPGFLSLLLNSRRVFENYKYFLVLKSTMILEHVFMTLLPMRYNSVRLEIKVLRISGNVLLFKNIKISLGLLITVRELLALFRENHCLQMSTAANNRIRGAETENFNWAFT